MAVFQHGRRRDNAGGRGFAFLSIELLNFSLLTHLQALHLPQVSVRRRESIVSSKQECIVGFGDTCWPTLKYCSLHDSKV